MLFIDVYFRISFFQLYLMSSHRFPPRVLFITFFFRILFLFGILFSIPSIHLLLVLLLFRMYSSSCYFLSIAAPSLQWFSLFWAPLVLNFTMAGYIVPFFLLIFPRDLFICHLSYSSMDFSLSCFISASFPHIAYLSWVFPQLLLLQFRMLSFCTKTSRQGGSRQSWGCSSFEFFDSL